MHEKKMVSDPHLNFDLLLQHSCKTKNMYNFYNKFFEFGQLRINYNLYQIGVPLDDPVHVVKRIMKELDFSSLLNQYNRLGRKGYNNPIMLFSVLVYSALSGVRAVDRIVELCARDIAYIWLAQGERPQRDTFYDFINNKLSKDILKDLYYQFMRRLQKEGLVSLEALFIDGTKIEANASRYTFVWRGSLNYHLVVLLYAIENGYHLACFFNSILT
ncbi:transposase [Serpentinicella alkaliphila]|uniref:Transposase n=1 Tax=Serpentinicella alkaliphila TaxID=1734049 RepID=A0A4R2TJD3_9FIRM|nr:transposase [Serpentinicella alkaliphila]QUH24755.1 transposase [Serpentinicella alkaliphila]TCQ03750.1 transposase [Serpentinicella alkaliphila]